MDEVFKDSEGGTSSLNSDRDDVYFGVGNSVQDAGGREEDRGKYGVGSWNLFTPLLAAGGQHEQLFYLFAL